MTQSIQICAFEGRVSQFLPGRRLCFVTLSKPIGSVTRAVLHAETMKCASIDETILKLSDTVRGTLMLGDGHVAEVLNVK